MVGKQQWNVVWYTSLSFRGRVTVYACLYADMPTCRHSGRAVAGGVADMTPPCPLSSRLVILPPCRVVARDARRTRPIPLFRYLSALAVSRAISASISESAAASERESSYLR